MRLASIFASVTGKARALLRDRKANVAMMFGLSLVPVLIATGAGIDFARGVMVHQRMSQALDAAALAVGNATSKPAACSSTGNTASKQACAALQTTAQQYFDQNYDHTQDSNYGTPSAVSIDIADQSVKLSSSLSLKLTLLGITTINIAQPDVTASSTVVWGQTKLWVALVLDNSGSMDRGDSNGTKMEALKDALTNTTYGLLKTLQAAAASDGDVKVGLVPFTRSVNIGKTTTAGTSSYIDWGEWEAPPRNVNLSANLGPGDNCPFTDQDTDWRGNVDIDTKSPFGFYCMKNGTNSSDSDDRVANVPSSGNICPGIDPGTHNPDHRDRYYNGCYDSVAINTSTTGTATNNTFCNNNSNCTVANKCGGYPQSSTSTNGHTSVTTTTVCSCSGSGNSRSCKTTATPVTTVTTFSHTWRVNAHSTWKGCIMDRQQKNKQTTINGGTGYRVAATKDYDESNTQPASSSSSFDDTQFPAENPASCLGAEVRTMGYDWSTISTKVSNMDPDGSTNQAIGMAHGWQMLTTGAPYGTGTLPAGTTKVLILFSDGLNTQDRWYGDGATEGTTEDGYIDDRMKATCTAAKADGVTIYSIYVHIGTNGSSAALSNCASDSSKYYDLTSSASIKDAFKDIAQKITNLRVSK